MICVDQSRESLQGDNSVFQELSDGLDTITLGTLLGEARLSDPPFP